MLKANIEKYKGDPSKILFMGYSARGHFATYNATMVDENTQVQALVSYTSLTDFVQELPKKGNKLGIA